MSTNERIGKNIKAIRKAYGDTQEELAFKLNMSNSAIANYEAGTRTVPYEVLKEIAEYYQVPIVALMYKDIGDIESVNINIDRLPCMVEVLFPIVYTDIAMTNKNFETAYKWHELLYYKLFCEGDYDEGLMFDCMRHYMEAREDNKARLETTANIISLAYCLIIIQRQQYILEEDCPAIYKKLIKENKEWECILGGCRAFDEREENNIIELFETQHFTKILKTSICFLESNVIFSDLARYYHVLGDCFDIYKKQDEDYERYNMYLNFEKMYLLAKLGNKYAAQVFSEVDNLLV